MAGMRMVVRAAWRSGITAFLVLGLVIGLGGGFAATALAGARRADSAYARLQGATLAPDHFLDAADLDAAAIARIARAPGVAAVARFQFTPVAPAGRSGSVAALVARDPAFLRRVYRPLVIRGRLPRPGASDEVVVNETLARRAHLRPGSRVELRGGFAGERDLGPATVVAVGRGIFDFGPRAGRETLLLPSAFLAARRDGLNLDAPPNALLRTEPGVSDRRLTRNLRRAVGHPVEVQSAAAEASAVERQLAVQSIGLAVLGVVALVATIVAGLQSLGRRYDRPLRDLPALVAMGFRPRRRLGLGAWLAVPTALVAAAVTAVVATLASPLVPTGFARSVDPTRGIRPDLAVLAVVAGLLALVCVGGGALLARRHRPRHERTVVAHELRLARGLAPGPRLGLRAALAPTRAPDGPAARGALLTTVLAVGVVVGVLVFGTSLTALVDTPADYGWSFDAAVSGGDHPLTELRPALRNLRSDPHVARAGFAAVVLLRVDGHDTEGYALGPRAVAMHPSLRAGRAPRADSEVALGGDLASDLGVGIGDVVTLRATAGHVRAHVVGIATYPELGNQADLATALSLTLSTARRIGAVEEGGLAVVRLAPGVGPAVLRRYRDAGEVLTSARPPRVHNLEQVGRLPFVLAGFLTALGVLAIGHGLWRTVRARRREFATLAAIGFRPRDLRATIRWQALAVVVMALVVGVPVGLLLGRTAWTAVADATGVVDRLVAPADALGAVVLGALGLGAVAGLAAGRALTRVAPGSALRSE